MRDKLWLVGAICLTAAVQSVAITPEFIADDYLHLYQLATLDTEHFMLATYAGHVLAVFHAALALLHWVFGLDARKYYLAVLATHLVNTALLWLLLRRFVTAARAACFAALWGMAPVHQGALAWISVYGHVLCTMLTLSALALLGHFFTLRRRPPVWVLSACVVLVLAGAASFGIGIAVALAFPAVAWLLAPPESEPQRVALWLSPLLLAPIAYLLLRPYVDPPPQGLSLAASWEFAGFLGYGAGALLLGPFLTATATHTAGWPVIELSLEQITHIDYVLAGGLALLLAGILWIADDETRRAIVAGVILYVATYGIIALGRVPPMFSSVAWLVTLPRYHYLSLAAATLTFGIASSVWDRSPLRGRQRVLLSVAAGLYAIVVALGSWVAARRMTDPLILAMKSNAEPVRRRLAAAIEDSPPGSLVAFDNAQFNPVKLVFRLAGKSAWFPGTAAYFAIVYPNNRVDGRTVRFVEPDAGLVRAVRQGPSGRMGELLMTQEEAAAAGITPHSLSAP